MGIVLFSVLSCMFEIFKIKKFLKEIYSTKLNINTILNIVVLVGEGNGNPFQYSCLENPMDGGWGRKELDTTERLHFHFPATKVQSLNHWTSRE